MISRIIQIIIAFIALFVLSPILLFVCFFIFIIEGESCIFIQDRIWKNKISYKILKVRTMKNNKITITWKLIRKLQIDEIPQLLNIIKWDMNFIWPRPLTICDIQRLWRWTKKHIKRFSIKPWITGLWQFVFECDKNLTLKYNLHYIDHKNIFLDLYISVMTIVSLFIWRQQTKIVFNSFNKKIVWI